MKKYFFLIAAMATLPFAFTACSSSDDGNNAIIILTPNSEFKDEAKTLTFNTMPQISETESIRSIQLTENGRYLIRIVEDLDEPAATTRATSDEVYTYLTGLYHILEKGVSYRLDGFGDLTMKATGTVLHINIKLVNGKEINIDSGISQTTPGQNHTQATLNLCQNWTVTKTRLRLTNKNGLKLGRDFQGCNLPEIKRYIENNSDCRIKETFEEKAILTNIEFNLDSTFKIYYEDGTDVGNWRWDKESEGTLKYEWEGHEMGNSFEAGNGVFEPKSESTGWLTIDAVLETDGVDYDVTLTFFISVDQTLVQTL